MGEIAEPGIDAYRVLRALGHIGYTPENAICDIVDNSVAAKATRITIELQPEPDLAMNRRNNASAYVIADNGSGMTKDGLMNALKLGSSDTDYEPDALGKFGLGLKSAALSQGDRLEVLSRDAQGDILKIVLDMDHIKQTRQYDCAFEELVEEDLVLWTRLIGEEHSGTLVAVRKIHKVNHPSVRATQEALLRQLGVIYQYFIAGKELSLTLDGNLIEAVDPLFASEANDHGSLDETAWDGRHPAWIQHEQEVVIDPEHAISVTVEATQLVHPPAFEANQGHVRDKYMISAQNYGYYVYRNRRLIGWAERFQGMIPPRQELWAFRGRIFLDSSADEVLNIDVKKSRVLLSEDAENALGELAYEHKRKSMRAWDNSGRLVRARLGADPSANANQALAEVDFPELLPDDPDDKKSEDERGKRATKDGQRKPATKEEVENAVKNGERVHFVNSLDDNLAWERAYDPSVGTIVRLNRGHRFVRTIYDIFHDDARVVLLLHSLFLSHAVSEAHAIRNIQSLDDETLEAVFQRYKTILSGMLYQATAEALETELTKTT